jgi:hypothetical protein
MDAQRWTSWGVSTNRTWPTARPSASRRRSSLKAVVLSASTVSQSMDRAATPGVIAEEDPRHDH